MIVSMNMQRWPEGQDWNHQKQQCNGCDSMFGELQHEKNSLFSARGSTQEPEFLRSGFRDRQENRDRFCETSQMRRVANTNRGGHILVPLTGPPIGGLNRLHELPEWTVPLR